MGEIHKILLYLKVLVICYSKMVTIPFFPAYILYLLYLMKMIQLRLAWVLFQNFVANIPQDGGSARDEIPLTSQGFTTSISLHVNFSSKYDGKLIFTYLLNIEYYKFYKKKVNCLFVFYLKRHIYFDTERNFGLHLFLFAKPRSHRLLLFCFL